MTAQVAADLRAAADVLERDGWTQGLYHRRRWFRRLHCPSGALLRVIQPNAQDGTSLTSSNKERWYEAVWAVQDHLFAAPGPGKTLERWNDTPGRTAAEVIAALRAAADAAEAEL